MQVRDRLRAADWTFWVPCVLSALAIAATIASLIEPRWIEELFEVSPDQGSGESEWWIAAVLAGVAVISLVVTGWRWRAIRPAA